MSDENMNDNDTVKNKKSEKAELISNFFFSFFFTFFVLIVIGQAALHFMGFSLLNVQTGSMSPKIPVNTLIFVQSTDPAEIREGDVITFVINQQGTLATHRVIKINSGSRTFVTKGDANNTDDGNISWDNVVGVVRFKIPKIGGFFQLVTDPKNRPVMIAVIAALLVSSFIWDFALNIRKKRRLKKQPPASGNDENSGLSQSANGT